MSLVVMAIFPYRKTFCELLESRYSAEFERFHGFDTQKQQQKVKQLDLKAGIYNR